MMHCIIRLMKAIYGRIVDLCLTCLKDANKNSPFQSRYILVGCNLVSIRFRMTIFTRFTTYERVTKQFVANRFLIFLVSSNVTGFR